MTTPDDLDYEPSLAQLDAANATRDRATRLAAHLSRAEVIAVLRAHKAGHAYPGQHSPGSARVTVRTIRNLAGPDARLLDPDTLALTTDGRWVARILAAEAARYL